MSTGDANNSQTNDDYWGRDGLAPAIFDALAASGKNLDALTIDDLSPMDHFHGGGKEVTVRLARLAGLTPGLRVLDVGGGLGGPARTLAVEFGCHVTVVDLTESYVHAAGEITDRLGLGERVSHHVGNALELPFNEGAFDVVWTQNSGMNIADKERLYVGFHRVLRPGGLLALQEPMAGPVQPPIFPLMWAVTETTSFLRTPVEMRLMIEDAGFRTRSWDSSERPLVATCNQGRRYLSSRPWRRSSANVMSIRDTRRVSVAGGGRRRRRKRRTREGTKRGSRSWWPATS